MQRRYPKTVRTNSGNSADNFGKQILPLQYTVKTENACAGFDKMKEKAVEDPCQKPACKLQDCLAKNNYQESKCFYELRSV
jgi:hypothetical protein